MTTPTGWDDMVGWMGKATDELVYHTFDTGFDDFTDNTIAGDYTAGANKNTAGANKVYMANGSSIDTEQPTGPHAWVRPCSIRVTIDPSDVGNFSPDRGEYNHRGAAVKWLASATGSPVETIECRSVSLVTPASTGHMTVSMEFDTTYEAASSIYTSPPPEVISADVELLDPVSGVSFTSSCSGDSS